VSFLPCKASTQPQHLFPYCIEKRYVGHLREFQMAAKADLQRPGDRKATDTERTPRLRASRSRRDNPDALYAPEQKSPFTRPRVGSYTYCEAVVCLSYVRLVELYCSTTISHVSNRLLAMSLTFLAASLLLLYNPAACAPATDLASHSDTANFCLIACDIVQSKNRRRVGRPITYKGDPDAKNLTQGERRKVKRRIANRESAQRVRARRAETLGELQIKVRLVPAHPHQLTCESDPWQEKCTPGCHAIDTGCTLHSSTHCTVKS